MSHYKGSVMFEDSNNLHVMNEKVQSLANGVYKEFESVIMKFGGEAVKGLMPIVVNILECLDHNIKDKQKNEVDLELSKVEIEHLKNQCDKEKILRKSTDNKYLEVEDLLEESKKHLNQLKINSDLNMKRLEMKIRNMQDQATRMEEKDLKFKEDYSKLHNKYSNLLKSHTELVHRTNESHLSVQSNQVKIISEGKKCSNCFPSETISTSLLKSYLRNTNIPNELPSKNFHIVEESTSDIDLHSEILAVSQKTPRNNSPDISDARENKDEINILIDEENTSDNPVEGNVNSSNNNFVSEHFTQEEMLEIYKEKINLDNFDSISQESSVPDNMAVDDMYGECMMGSNTFNCKALMGESQNHIFEIEDDSELIEEINQALDPNHAMKNVSLFEEFSILEEDVGTDYVSVGAEVDKLIQENAELLATKNALNVLKDDLIADVEELSGELELARDELTSIRFERENQDLKITELEEELKKCKDELKQLQSKLESKEQDADKTTFSRVELVRILMERNQYKEKWMELQEAVRWAETVRASRAHPELVTTQENKKSKTSAVWGFFNSFLGREKDDN